MNYLDLINIDLLEIVFLYSVKDGGIAILSESKLFDKINILISPFIKRIFKFYNYEIFNKTIYELTLNIKKTKYNYKQISNMIENEIDIIYSAHISYDNMKNKNFSMFFPIHNIPNMDILYEYIHEEDIAKYEIELNYMDGLSSIFYYDKKFDKPEIFIHVTHINNKYTYNWYYSFNPAIINELKIKNPIEFFKKLFIQFCYYHIKFEVQLFNN